MELNVEKMLFNKMEECRENDDSYTYELLFSFDSGLKFTPYSDWRGPYICLGSAHAHNYYYNFSLEIKLDSLLDIVDLYISSDEKERDYYFGFTLEDSVSKGYKDGTISLYTPKEFSDYLQEEDDLLDKQEKLKELGLSSYEELEALDPKNYVIEDSCSYTGFLRLFHK